LSQAIENPTMALSLTDDGTHQTKFANLQDFWKSNNAEGNSLNDRCDFL